MVQFKSWKDKYLFLQKYYNYTCLQCKHYHKDLNDEEEYKDSEYARFFCPHMIAMVRLDFQLCCHEWEDKEGNPIPSEEDVKVFNFSDKIADILDAQENPVSIEDIETIIQENE